MEGNAFDRNVARHPVMSYAVTKAAPLLLSLFFALTGFDPFSSVLLSICAGIAELWLVKNIHGAGLIGLRWWIEAGEGLMYYTKPDPYVQDIAQSNAFWIGLFAGAMLYAISALCCLQTMYSVMFFIMDAFQVFNLSMFLCARNKAKRSVEKNLLTILQDEEINFELVKDDEDDAQANNEQ